MHLLPDPLMAFPTTAVGTTSEPQTLTILNEDLNGAAATITSIAITGADASQFALVNNACTGATLSDAGAASCTLSVVFQPTRAGAAAAAVTVVDSLSAAPLVLPLSGSTLAQKAAAAAALPSNRV